MPRWLVKYFWAFLAGCFLLRLAFELVDPVQRVTPSSNLWRSQIEQKGEGRTNEFFLLELGHSSLQLLDVGATSCQAFRLRPGLRLQVPWFSGHQVETELHWFSWASSSETADNRTSQSTWSCEPISHNLFLSLSPSSWQLIGLLWLLFLCVIIF